MVIRNTCGDEVLAEIAEPQLDENAENQLFSTVQAYALAFDASASQLAVAREGELSVWAIEVLD